MVALFVMPTHTGGTMAVVEEKMEGGAKCEEIKLRGAK